MICPDCDGWGLSINGGPCVTCNGEGEVPDDNFPTGQDVEPQADSTEHESEDPPPFQSELDADWWKQETDDDYQEEA